jgi:hypothetical protein
MLISKGIAGVSRHAPVLRVSATFTFPRNPSRHPGVDAPTTWSHLRQRHRQCLPAPLEGELSDVAPFPAICNWFFSIFNQWNFS